MNSAQLLCQRADLTPRSLAQLMHACCERLAAGQRLLTLYGRAADPSNDSNGAETVVVTAVFLPDDGPLQLLRGEASAGQHYPALTAAFPAAQIFERELWNRPAWCPTATPGSNRCASKASASSV